MRSDEYENGGWDSATARPAHTAQNEKNHRVPRPAARRSGGTRMERPGSLRSDSRDSDPAPITPMMMPSSHGVPTTALSPSATASAPNCVDSTYLGENRSTSGTSRPSPMR